MKQFTLILALLLLASCELINDFLDPGTGSDLLIIGELSDDTYIQKLYDPAFEIEVFPGRL